MFSHFQELLLTVTTSYSILCYFIPPPPSLSLENCAAQLLLENVSRWTLWMTAMNNLCCEASLLIDSGPKCLLQFYYNNPSYNSFPFLPVTVEKSSGQLSISQFPTSTCQSHSEGQTRNGSGTDLEQVASH